MMLLHAMRSWQIFLRVAGAVLFILAGGWLALLSLIASSLLPVPSFWCIPCFWAFIPVGLLWGWRPCWAAALSIGPLVAAAAALRSQSGIWAVIWAGCLAIAAILVFLALRDGRGWKIPLVISFAFVAAAFGADRLLTNKVTVKTFPMGVTINGRPPWSSSDVVYSANLALLYRRIGPIYCMLMLHSPELRNRLGRRRIVPVEFDVVSDFGHPKSYTMRSVNGVPVKPGEYEIFTEGQFEGDGCPLLLFQRSTVDQQSEGPKANSVPGSCPVTKAPPAPFAPSAFVPPVPYRIEPDNPNLFQYGTDKLWVELPKSGIWKELPVNYATPRPSWRQTVAWGRSGYNRQAEPQPKLQVTGKRLDGPAPPLWFVRSSVETVTVFDGPQPPPIMESAIDLPTLGCWELTGQYGDDMLTFVVWVADSPKPYSSLAP